MGKKIFLAIFGGIALCGLALVIVGFALGVNLHGFNISNGRLVYEQNGETVPLGWNWGWNWDGDWGWRGGWFTNRRDGDGARVEIPAPFSANELEHMDVDISAGNLVIRTGDAFGLTVEGPMEYTTHWDGGTWRLESICDGVDIRNWRFWWNGVDMTTTFTLTLPADFDKMSLTLDMGEADVEGFTLDTLDCNGNMGSFRLDGVSAQTATLDCDMGEIVAKDFEAGDCTLDCDMGHIDVDGDINELLTANCSIGGITARLSRPDEFGYSVEVGLGDVEIDGEYHSGGLSASAHSGNESDLPFYHLTCDMGEVEIMFND